MSTTKTEGPKSTEGPIDLSTPKMNGFDILEKRPSFHPYRLEKDDDVVCLLEKNQNTEAEYSAASPPYTPDLPEYHAVIFANISALVSVVTRYSKCKIPRRLPHQR
ncbi:hypothetical protein TNCT_363581 [Trichonephila clavata]|uniref:Uncharacterized protein n=1 Tax=Trichonephila clavata TaxID=2740835 RepID=A0A8X6F7A3_TRICU|nr:hypothetical protein TNCT_363581 [Trichonephila clavata]